MGYRGAVLTTKIRPYTVSGIIRGTPPAAGTCCARTRGHTQRSSYNSTTRHTPLSHCPLPAGHTTCIALYSMRINYTYNSPQRITRKQTTRSHAKSTKRRRRSKRPKENSIYIYLFSFLFFYRKIRTRGENFARGEKKSPPGRKFRTAPSFPY